MNNCPDPTEKRSRRTFAKSFAVALMTSPFVPSPIRAQKPSVVEQALMSANPGLAPLPLNLVLNHLPPLIFRSGSLEIESEVELVRFDNDAPPPAPRRPKYKYIQDPDKPLAYGDVKAVSIVNNRGECLDTIPLTSSWQVILTLQKFNGTNYETVTRPEQQVIVSGQRRELKFEIGKKHGDKKDIRRNNRDFKKYRFDKIGDDDKNFRIGQVSVTNSGSTKSFPKELQSGPGLAEDGFEVFITFTHPEDYKGFIRKPDHFWKRLRKVLGF